MVGHIVACQSVDSCIQVEAEEAYERIEGRRTGQFLKGEPPRQHKSTHRPSLMRFRFEARAPFVSTTTAAFAKRFLSIGRHNGKIEQRLWIILPALANPSRRKRQRDATPNRLRRVFSTDAYRVARNRPIKRNLLRESCCISQQRDIGTHEAGRPCWSSCWRTKRHSNPRTCNRWPAASLCIFQRGQQS